MTQTHIVDFTTDEQAKRVFELVAPHAGTARRDGETVEMDDAGMAFLRNLPADTDGHAVAIDGHLLVLLRAEVGDGWHTYRVDTETIRQDTVLDAFGR